MFARASIAGVVPAATAPLVHLHIADGDIGSALVLLTARLYPKYSIGGCVEIHTIGSGAVEGVDGIRRAHDPFL